MTRHTWLKLLRYGLLFPLDLLRAVPVLLVAPWWGCRCKEAARRTARGVAQLYAWRRLDEAALTSAAVIVQRAGLGGGRMMLGMMQWPAALESCVLGFSANAAHHRARLELVRTVLPAGQVVLDLGGSCGGIPEGGLLHMGYPHQPEQVTIVDLPPNVQYWKHKAPPAELKYGTTKVSYQYSGMDDLSAFLPSTVDGVWGGQCIEHVPRAEAVRAMQEVFRVLRPGGWFCLDTPNRYLTQLLVRVGFIHPEHFAEYYPEELTTLLQRSGFEVRRKLAVSAMPVSRQLGRFWKHEVEYGALLGPSPDDGFSFFVEARKPANLDPFSSP